MIEQIDQPEKIEVRYLEALRAVVEEGSFGAAARRLGYTQSTISHHISGLEQAVDIAVFERPGGPRPVRLTPAGKIMLGCAENVLEHLRATRADLEALRSGTRGTLVVGTFQSASVRVLPEVLRRLAESRPGLRVNLHESDEQELLLAELIAGELDLTFTMEPVTDERIEVLELFEDPVVVISAAGGPLNTGAKAVLIDELGSLPLIGQHQTPYRRLVEDGLRRAGIEPQVVFRSGDNEAVQALARVGVGHAVLPLLAIDPNLPGVVIRRVEPPIPPRTVGVAFARSRRHPGVPYFIEATRDVCRELVQTTPMLRSLD